MYTRNQLLAVGESAAEQMPDRSVWIHRRVEQITFPMPTDRVYRRKMSIDFTIPPVTPIKEDGHSRYYVPLSLLSRWPPLLRIDLRGVDGDPVPLLTRRQGGPEGRLRRPLHGARSALVSEAFGLSPFEIDFEAPHIGGSGSYHLAVSVPPPLLISDAAVVIDAPRTADGYPEETEVIAACTSKDGEEQCHTPEGVLNLYAHASARDARFYVSGPRTGSTGQVRIATIVQGSGLIRPGAFASIAITALIAAVALQLGSVMEEKEPAVTTLLIAPALLAYLIVRPGDHAVVGQFVSALRRTLVVLGGLPLAAATALSITHNWHLGLKLGMICTSIAAGLLSLVMLAAWLIPRRESWRLRFSSSPPVAATKEAT